MRKKVKQSGDFVLTAPDYRTHDPPTYAQACMGMMVCPHCARALICGDVLTLNEEQGTYSVKQSQEFHQPPEENPFDYDSYQHPNESEKNDMDLKSHRSKNKPQGGKFARRPLLKAKDIPAKGMKCKVIEFRTAPKQMEYSDFLLDVDAGKKEFTIGLRSQSVLLDMIMDELGTNTDKYPGKQITFVRGGNKGQYINVG